MPGIDQQEIKKSKRRKVVSRADFLRDVGAKVAADSFLPEEVWVVMFGPSNDARKAARKAYLRSLPLRFSLQQAQVLRGSSVTKARPASSLSRLNCSRIFPPLLLPEADLATSRISELCPMIERLHHSGVAWPRLLDALVASSGISWATAAAVLTKMLQIRISEADVQVVSKVRNFWRRYGEGRVRLLGLQEVGEVPAYAGDWAHFDHAQLELLVPGIILPDHCRRAEYLINYIAERGQEALDLYTLTGQPLCRHPFRKEANPFRNLSSS